MYHHLTGFFAESVSAEIAHWVLAALFAVLGAMLRQVINNLKKHEGTRVKANLCFDDLVERKPIMERAYNALMSRNGN